MTIPAIVHDHHDVWGAQLQARDVAGGTVWTNTTDMLGVTEVDEQLAYYVLFGIGVGWLIRHGGNVRIYGATKSLPYYAASSMVHAECDSELSVVYAAIAKVKEMK